jgi:hypothetical protein
MYVMQMTTRSAPEYFYKMLLIQCATWMKQYVTCSCAHEKVNLNVSILFTLISKLRWKYMLIYFSMRNPTQSTLAPRSEIQETRLSHSLMRFR